MRNFLFLAVTALAAPAPAQEILLKPGASATIHAAMDTTVTCESSATKGQQCFCEFVPQRYSSDEFHLFVVAFGGTKILKKIFNSANAETDCENDLKARAICN